MMNSLIYVDYIVVFDQKSFKYFKKIKPDILIKGNDYSLKDIVGYDYIKNMGKLNFLKTLMIYLPQLF